MPPREGPPMECYGSRLISTWRHCFGYGTGAGPPMQVGVAPHELGVLGQVDARLAEDGIEGLQRVEGPFGERLVDQRPQTLRRLQLGEYGGSGTRGRPAGTWTS